MTLPWDRRLTGSLEVAARTKNPKTNHDGVQKSRPTSRRANSFASNASSTGRANSGELDTITVQDVPPPYEADGVIYVNTDEKTAETSDITVPTTTNIHLENDGSNRKDQFFTPDLDAYPNPQMPWDGAAVHGRISSEQRWSETAKLPAKRQPILSQTSEDLSNIDPALRVAAAPPPVTLPQTTNVFKSTTTIHNERHGNKAQFYNSVNSNGNKSMYDFYQQLEKQKMAYPPNTYSLQQYPVINNPCLRGPTPVDKFRAAQKNAPRQNNNMMKGPGANVGVRRPGTAFSAQYIRAGVRASMMKSGKGGYPYARPSVVNISPMVSSIYAPMANQIAMGSVGAGGYNYSINGLMGTGMVTTSVMSPGMVMSTAPAFSMPMVGNTPLSGV